MSDERFADVFGWPGYRVSTLGRLFGKHGRQHAGYYDKDGYHCVLVKDHGKRAGLKVHRLVAGAFIGPIPEGMQVNHINGVKDDNRVENLEIVTPSANTKHGFDVLGRVGKNTNPSKGEQHHNASMTAAVVQEIRRLYAAGGHTQKELAALFGTGQNHISRLVRRESWAHLAD
jgi:predicted XRE-type DNA-binding protein